MLRLPSARAEFFPAVEASDDLSVGQQPAEFFRRLGHLAIGQAALLRGGFVFLIREFETEVHRLRQIELGLLAAL